MSEQPWYTTQAKSAPLQQGAIISDLEWFDFTQLSSLRNPDGTSIEFPTVKYSVIVLTQSCDLENDKTPFIHVCRVYTLEEVFKGLSTTSKKGKLQEFERLKSNRVASLHLLNTLTLNSPSALSGDYLVANFSKSFVIPKKYLLEHVRAHKDAKLTILNVPYRESLAQRYGLFFSRVGNPVNIDPLEKSKHLSTEG